jgi:hypothetical protein
MRRSALFVADSKTPLPLKVHEDDVEGGDDNVKRKDAIWRLREL